MRPPTKPFAPILLMLAWVAPMLPAVAFEAADPSALAHAYFEQLYGFDRVELALSPSSGLALRARYFRNSNEIRRVLVSPVDVRDYGDRRLPVRRRISAPPDDGVTELVLRNLVLDPVLPESLFTRHNLRVQRFPSF
jgi:hypothetical protein